MSLTLANDPNVWRIAGKRLSEAGALLPTPVHEALHCIGKLLVFISAVLTSMEISKEVREGVQVIADRAEQLARMIEKHPGVFQRDGEEFLERFKAVVNGAREFFETASRRSLATKLLHSKRDKATCERYRSEINELHVEFIAHLAHEQDSKGPHELIKSSRLQHFWKYRMKDAHEVRWESFWRQFQGEFPEIQARYVNLDVEETRKAIQNLSLEGHLKYVSPWGVNNVWEALKDGDMSALTKVKPRPTRSLIFSEHVGRSSSVPPPPVSVITRLPEYQDMKEAGEYVGEHPQTWSWFKKTYGSDLFDMPSQLR